MNRNETIYKAAWQFTVACLWPNRVLSHYEQQLSKLRVQRVLAQEKDSFKAYMDYCGAVYMYRFVCINSKGAHKLPLPSQWLEGEDGYRQAVELSQGVDSLREEVPLAFHEQRGLFEAVLEMTEDGSENTFYYWEKWFRQRKAQPELRLFYLYTSKFSTQIAIP